MSAIVAGGTVGIVSAIRWIAGSLGVTCTGARRASSVGVRCISGGATGASALGKNVARSTSAGARCTGGCTLGRAGGVASTDLCTGGSLGILCAGWGAVVAPLSTGVCRMGGGLGVVSTLRCTNGSVGVDAAGAEISALACAGVRCTEGCALDGVIGGVVCACG